MLDAWRFEHNTTLTRVKDRMGAGDWLRGQTEHCLMVRGHPIVALSNQTTVLFGPVRAYSRKPKEFMSWLSAFFPRRVMPVYLPERTDRAGICTATRSQAGNAP